MSQFQKIQNNTVWQNLLDRALFKTFFHSFEWESFLEEKFPWLSFERYSYKDQALLSVAKYTLTGKEKIVSTPFCEYGGPIPLVENIDGRNFKENLFNEFKESFKIKFHPKLPKYFSNIHLKGSETANNTYMIEGLDKLPEQKILDSFRKTLRHIILNPAKDVLTSRCQTKEELRDFYRLYEQTTRRHKNIPYPYEFFEYFLNNDSSEIILAKVNDKIIAGSIFLYYEGIVHYFVNASDFKYKDKNPNHLILWHQIKKRLQGEFTVFDLGGTGRGSSLEVFKKGWGANEYSIFELKNDQDSGLKKSKLRNIYSILPNFILRKLDNKFIKFKL